MALTGAQEKEVKPIDEFDLKNAALEASTTALLKSLNGFEGRLKSMVKRRECQRICRSGYWREQRIFLPAVRGARGTTRSRPAYGGTDRQRSLWRRKSSCCSDEPLSPTPASRTAAVVGVLKVATARSAGALLAGHFGSSGGGMPLQQENNKP